jgi:membrane protein involved in colicin uptake
MWGIFGSKSEYENTDAEEAERHRLVWVARKLAENEKNAEEEAKAKADAEEAKHDAQIGW